MTPDESGTQRNLLLVATLMLRHRWTIVGAGVLTALAVIGVTLWQPRYYTASATFMPQAPSARSPMGGIASQLGINLGEASTTDSPEFYANLVTSKDILREIATSRFRLDRGGGGESLFMDAVAIPANDAALRELRAIEYLRKHVGAATLPRLGTVTIQVRTPSAALSLQVVERILSLVSQFNQETRRSRAAAEREFIARRLAAIRTDLRGAERELQAFLTRNRQYQSAPALIFEHDRLVRDVGLQQQLFSTMSEAYEQASVEAVRDTPVITVIEKPSLPVLPDRRLLLLKAAVAFVVGLGLSALVLVVMAFRPSELWS